VVGNDAAHNVVSGSPERMPPMRCRSPRRWPTTCTRSAVDTTGSSPAGTHR
jgi:hypothetical protein